ncbi:polysaccharide biosynthesis tyrosine autokinase [Bradyrhizobium sp. BR 10289]|uniref:polysaccharide biosynthesis tyrosine autokinase n=1 Tax=Bradyrhizobium sp. BR 10289 TaxID=2749993 RepID=UPI001C64FA59|nr:polysaccharide biosynthesis tyrosine autokinase [Bradyrhizobium sp. BR 10289]MBW7971551.1 polysaccharide biosynthesis tyrosine autokinase [Bradyrhizobium sp. BR 10289]
MLQVDPKAFRTAPTAPEQPQRDQATSQDSLLAFRALIRRQLPYIVLTVIACVGLASAYCMTAEKKYTSTAALIIDSRKTQMLNQQSTSSPMGVDTPLDSATVDSQVEILKSDKVGLAVIKDLDLIHNPEFVSKDSSWLSSVLGLFFERTPPSEQSLTRLVLMQLQRNLAVKRKALSYVIEVSYKSRDPELSAHIANAVAEAYFVDALEAKYQASKRAASWLQDRLKELRAQASAADRAVADYKAKNNIVDTGGRLLTEQQLAETNSALTIARAQTAEAQARYDRLSSILNDENRDVNDLFKDIATVTDSLRNDVITRLRQQYLDLSAREADWSKRYGPQHLAVVNIRNQMREIRKSITDELRRIGESYKSDLEIARAREASVQASLKSTIDQSNDTNQAQIVLRDLDSNAQSARALADNFLQLYMLSVQQQSFPMTDARLITDASPPLTASDPKTLVIILGAIMGGCLLGFAVGWTRDALDQVVRTRDDAEALLGVSCLAVTPRIGASDATKLSRGSFPVRMLRASGRMLGIGRERSSVNAIDVLPTNASEGAVGRPGSLLIADDIMRYVQDSPFSRFTEAVRSIKVAADIAFMDHKTRVIGFTSALPNEGKTTISASFAQILALAGNKVVLVDADIRNPSVTRALAPTATQGLLDVVLGKIDLDSAILKDPETQLAFLPTVVPSRVAQSSEFLSSSGMAKTMEALREKYDWIVVDLSPLTPVIDVRATSRLIDAYVLVIEWGRTDRDAIVQALKDAPMLHDQIIGSVLNKANVDVLNRYDSYRGNYYYKNYYSRYGYVD